jgi:hypothetical protein
MKHLLTVKEKRAHEAKLALEASNYYSFLLVFVMADIENSSDKD